MATEYEVSFSIQHDPDPSGSSSPAQPKSDFASANVTQMGPDMQARLQPIMNPEGPAIEVSNVIETGRTLADDVESVGLDVQGQYPAGILAETLSAGTALIQEAVHDIKPELPAPEIAAPVSAPEPVNHYNADLMMNPSPNMMT